MLAVLVERGGADGAQLAAGEHRLEQVGGVDCALGGAGADDRVQLVHEQDHLAVGLLDLLEDGLEALLELAAVLGAVWIRHKAGLQLLIASVNIGNHQHHELHSCTSLVFIWLLHLVV